MCPSENLVSAITHLINAWILSTFYRDVLHIGISDEFDVIYHKFSVLHGLSCRELISYPNGSVSNTLEIKYTQRHQLPISGRPDPNFTCSCLVIHVYKMGTLMLSVVGELKIVTLLTVCEVRNLL